MHLPLLTDVVVLLGVSLGMLYLSHWIRLPSIVASPLAWNSRWRTF